MVKILQKQVEVALENDFLFRCEQENIQGPQEFKTHPMSAKMFKVVEHEVKQRIMKSGNNIWNDHSNFYPRSFVGFLQVYSDKTATTLKANAMVAYPIHVVFLNCSASFRRFLINREYTLVGFLPVAGETTGIYENDGMEEDNFLTRNISTEEIIPLQDTITQTSAPSGPT